MNAGDVNPDGQGASYSAGDPLARPITDREVFFAVINHAAELAGIDPGHLATSIRLGAVPGELCTARRIHDAAAALAGAGYRSPVTPPPRGPSPDVLAADLASIERGMPSIRGPRGERAPRPPRVRRPRGRPRKQAA